ncbi:MAG: hypothetical protein RR482_00170 [Clostridia bacterium]
MQHLQILVIGASVAGIAIAVARPRETLVMESGMLFGAEFIAALQINPHAFPSFAYAEARALREECCARGLLNARGEYHMPPLHALLARRLYDSGAQVCCYTRVLDIQPLSNRFLVTYFDAEGTHALIADHIVRTTDHEAGEKKLCAMMTGSIPPAKQEGSAQFLQGFYADEVVLKFSVMGKTWPQARNALHRYWQDRYQAADLALRMASVAPVFAYDFDAPIIERDAEGQVRCVSASFPDALSAFEGGFACATNLL